jgi:hypothetical protein
MTRPTRAELAEMVGAIRAEGATHLEVAETLGISKSYASELASDPTGRMVDARRRRLYSGTCQECGAQTGASGSPRTIPKHCRKCAPRHNPKKMWDRDTVILACQEFAARYGRPPNAVDWHPPAATAQGHAWRVERFYEDACWPHLTTVRRYFGGWNTMIEAAGFTPNGPGHYPRTSDRHGAHLSGERAA